MRDPLAARDRGRPHPLVPQLMARTARRRAGGTPGDGRADRGAGSPSPCTPTTTTRGAASYGLEAAEALGLDPARVFKTLLASVDGRLVVGVVPVSGQLDLKALAAAVGGKQGGDGRPGGRRARDRVRRRRHLPDRPEAARTRRCSTSPPSASATVFVSGGRRGLDLELAPADLVSGHRGDGRRDPALAPRRWLGGPGQPGTCRKARPSADPRDSLTGGNATPRRSGTTAPR